MDEDFTLEDEAEEEEEEAAEEARFFGTKEDYKQQDQLLRQAAEEAARSSLKPLGKRARALLQSPDNDHLLITALKSGCCSHHCLLVLVGSLAVRDLWKLYAPMRRSERQHAILQLLRTMHVAEPQTTPHAGDIHKFANQYFRFHVTAQGSQVVTCPRAFAKLHCIALNTLRRLVDLEWNGGKRQVVHSTPLMKPTKADTLTEKAVALLGYLAHVHSVPVDTEHSGLYDFRYFPGFASRSDVWRFLHQDLIPRLPESDQFYLVSLHYFEHIWAAHYPRLGVATERPECESCAEKDRAISNASRLHGPHSAEVLTLRQARNDHEKRGRELATWSVTAKKLAEANPQTIVSAAADCPSKMICPKAINFTSHFLAAHPWQV